MPLYQPVDYYSRAKPTITPMGFAKDLESLESDRLMNQQNQLSLQQQQQAPARQEAYKIGLQQLDRNDPGAVANFNVQFPEMAEQTQQIVTGQQEQTQKAYEFKSQQEKDLVKDASGKLLRAVQTGKPGLIDQTIDQVADIIRATGDPTMTPELLKERAREDPEKFKHAMAGVYNASGGKAADYGYKQEKPLTPYESETIDVRKEANKLRKDEIALKNLEFKRDKAKDALNKEKIQVDIDQKREAVTQTKRKAYQAGQDGIATIKSNIATVERVLTHKGLEAAAGIGDAFPTWWGSDAAGFESQLETLKSENFLGAIEAMKGLGALSEGEGKKLGASVGALDLKMSDEALKKELTRIKEKLSVSLSKYIARLPKDPDAAPEAPTEGTVQDGFKFLGGDPSQRENWRQI